MIIGLLCLMAFVGVVSAVTIHVLMKILPGGNPSSVGIILLDLN